MMLFAFKTPGDWTFSFPACVHEALRLAAQHRRDGYAVTMPSQMQQYPRPEAGGEGEPDGDARLERQRREQIFEDRQADELIYRFDY